MATMKTIRQSAPGIAGMRPPPNAPAAVDDPVADALAKRRQLLAFRVEQGSIEEAESAAERDRMKAEMDKLKTEVELHQVRRAAEEVRQTATGGGGASDMMAMFMQFMQQQLGSTQAELQAVRQQMAEATSVQMMRQLDEIKEAAFSARSSGDTEDHIVGLSKAIQDVKALNEVYQSMVPPSPQAIQDHRQLEIEMQRLKMQEEHEFRMLDLQEKREARAQARDERNREAEVRQRIRQEELGVETRRVELQAKMWEGAAPLFVDIARQRWGTGESLPQLTSGAADQAVAPTPAPPVDVQCAHCQRPVTIAHGQTSMICPHCRMLSNIQYSGEDAHE